MAGEGRRGVNCGNGRPQYTTTMLPTVHFLIPPPFSAYQCNALRSPWRPRPFIPGSRRGEAGAAKSRGHGFWPGVGLGDFLSFPLAPSPFLLPQFHSLSWNLRAPPPSHRVQKLAPCLGLFWADPGGFSLSFAEGRESGGGGGGALYTHPRPRSLPSPRSRP